MFFYPAIRSYLALDSAALRLVASLSATVFSVMATLR